VLNHSGKNNQRVRRKAYNLVDIKSISVADTTSGANSSRYMRPKRPVSTNLWRLLIDERRTEKKTKDSTYRWSPVNSMLRLKKCVPNTLKKDWPSSWTPTRGIWTKTLSTLRLKMPAKGQYKQWTTENISSTIFFSCSHKHTLEPFYLIFFFQLTTTS